MPATCGLPGLADSRMWSARRHSTSALSVSPSSPSTTPSDDMLVAVTGCSGPYDAMRIRRQRALSSRAATKSPSSRSSAARLL